MLTAMLPASAPTSWALSMTAHWPVRARAHAVAGVGRNPASEGEQAAGDAVDNRLGARLAWGNQRVEPGARGGRPAPNLQVLIKNEHAGARGSASLAGGGLLDRAPAQRACQHRRELLE